MLVARLEVIKSTVENDEQTEKLDDLAKGEFQTEKPKKSNKNKFDDLPVLFRTD